IAAGPLGATGNRLADGCEVGLERTRHRSGRDHDREETTGTTAAMGKPPGLLAGAPTCRQDSARGDAFVFELKPNRGLDVEPNIAPVGLKVTILAAIARPELLRDLGPHLVAAATDARPDQTVGLSGGVPVGEMQGLHRLGRDPGQRASPSGMRAGDNPATSIE